MNQLVSQLPLGVRVQALKESVLSTRAMKEQSTREEAALLDELAQAEAQVAGHAYGWEEATLSGLIPEGENPYIPAPTPPPVAPTEEKPASRSRKRSERW